MENTSNESEQDDFIKLDNGEILGLIRLKPIRFMLCTDRHATYNDCLRRDVLSSATVNQANELPVADNDVIILSSTEDAVHLM